MRHPATGCSPAELVFGRRFRDWIPQLSANDAVDGEIRDHDMVYKQSAKTSYDLKHRAQQSDLQLQDRVLMRNLVPKNKLSSMYLPEPASVVEKQGNSVMVQTDDGRRYRRNSSHLKRLIDNQGDETIRQELPDESSYSNWATPTSEPQACSSTPIAERYKGVRDEVTSRPKRETKRPLRFEDYDLDF